MKILFAANHLNIGGIANYILALGRAFAARGWASCVASSGGALEPEFAKSGIKFIKVDFRTKSELSPKVLSGAFRLSEIAREEGADIIHAHTRVTQVAAAIASRLAHVPYIVTCHGFFRRRLGRMLFGCWGDKVIAISGPVRESLINDFMVDPRRIELIHNGVELDKFSKERSPEDERDGLVIGTIGRLSPVKGHRFLIEAIANLSCREVDVRAIIVGDGPEEDNLKKLAKGFKVGGRVHFFKSDLDTAKYLAMMDVFVFPSIKEGLGLALLEAMAAGKACVASDIGGISDIIKNGENGILVKVGDVRALADSIFRLVVDVGLRTRLGAKARETAVSRFSLETMTDRTLNLYNEVLNAHANQ